MTDMQEKRQKQNGQLKKIRRWGFVFFVLMFLVSLIVTMPARLGQALMLPDNVSISRWQGTLWDGQADHISINNHQGQIILEGQLSWDVQWLSVFTGKLCASFYALESQVNDSIDNQLAEIRGEACLQRDTLSLREVSFSLPAERMLYNAEVSLSGVIQGRLNNLVWHMPKGGSQPRIVAAGQGLWRDIDLAVPGMTALRQVDWPDIPFTISSADPDSLRIAAVVDGADTSAQPRMSQWPISALSVNLKLSTSGAYQTEILLLPDNQIDQELNSWLAMMAEAGSGDFAGGYRYFIASP